MGLSILFTGPEGDDGPFSLATASGWRRFGEWVGSLPPGEFKALRTLCDTGQVNDTSALAADLAGVLDTAPPGHRDVQSTASALAENIGVGDSFESAIVADEDGEEEVEPPLANGAVQVRIIEGHERLVVNGWVTLENGQRIFVNTFCPTGEGGGVDPSCSSSESASTKDTPQLSEDELWDKAIEEHHKELKKVRKSAYEQPASLNPSSKVAGVNYTVADLTKASKSAGEALFGDALVHHNPSEITTKKLSSLREEERYVDDFEYMFTPSTGKGRDASGDKIGKHLADTDGKVYLYNGADSSIRIIDTKTKKK